MPSFLKYFVVVALASLTILASDFAYSEQDTSSSDVTIEDTGGTVRASGSAVEGKSAIEFRLQDASGKAAEGVEVTLTNKNDPGAVHKAFATAGSVVFADVGPGIWVVATQDASITFMDVMFLSDPALVGAGAAAGGLGSSSVLGASLPLYAVGAGVIAVPAVAIANESGKNNNRDDSSDVQTPTPAATSIPEPTLVPTRRPTPIPTPNDSPSPISPSS